MADENLELNETQLAGASGGVITDGDKSGVTYTCPNCGGIIKWKKFPERNGARLDEAWACDGCWYIFDEDELKDCSYFITKSF